MRLRWKPVVLVLRRAGIGLVEVIIALFILSVAILAALFVLPVSRRSQAQGRNYLFASQICRGVIEEVVAQTAYPPTPPTRLPWGGATLGLFSPTAFPPTPVPPATIHGVATPSTLPSSLTVMAGATPSPVVYTPSLTMTLDTPTPALSPSPSGTTVTVTHVQCQVSWKEEQPGRSPLTRTVVLQTTVGP